MSWIINRKSSARVFLLHGTELLQLARNENKVTLAAVHQLEMPSLSETRSLLHTLD